MSDLKAAKILAKQFLQEASLFQLGDLPTEQCHPKTRELSKLANVAGAKDLVPTIDLLKSIDLEALKVLESKALLFEDMQRDISSTLSKKGRIYICGCGATGRLALSLETIWKQTVAVLEEQPPESVISLMAGGDVALIKAVEGFEDFPEYGARHLSELGFTKNDLLISSTEGGETPYVIGATEHAVKISSKKPYFVYCNPDDVLCNKVERSRCVIQNAAIKKISLPIGPMSLSGSTRLQACTVMMLGIGLAIFSHKKVRQKNPLKKEISSFIKLLHDTKFDFLAPFVISEANLYQQKKRILYATNDYGMTVLTDTTERSPTFSLTPFENIQDKPENPALCYLSLCHAKSPEDGWEKLLGHPPRPLEWKEGHGMTGKKRLLGFDFSHNAEIQRLASSQYQKFSILREKTDRNQDAMIFSLQNEKHSIPLLGMPILFEHLLLKVILNIHSLLVMGRLHRYESNVMTWVKPSNKKLIDRSIRYILQILRSRNITSFSYEDVAYQLFNESAALKDNESVVLRTCESLMRRNDVSQ